jgi:acrylyl-CoA reductase (NADPH)
VRRFPHVPGIDAAGTVLESRAPEFSAGDNVLVTGFQLGAPAWGGFSELIRVPAAWVVPLPPGLSPRESMIFGTAGFTAALSIQALREGHIEPTHGEIVVTGATGGVGSIAVALLAKLGFHVVAATGKTGEKEFLTALGAKAIISREEANDTSGRPLQKGRWAGVVDTVGGNILATALKSAKYGGLVAACGNAMSAELNVNVFPFILRGVSLLGVDSVEVPLRARAMAWQKLAGEWKIDLSRIVTEVSLEELNPKIDEILRGAIRGRVVVDLSR